MEYNLYTLRNGIRVLHKDNPSSNITHCCLVVNTGSRDEGKGKEGLAHFIEHLLFKGTEKRNTYHLLNRMEVVGGELNAYTTKEQICIHASFLTPHLERAVDLLTDILFHSKFPPKEMEKEKSVIIDEIESYLDLPEEAIGDDFETLLFKGHPLGNNILGTPETVNAFTKRDIEQFFKTNFATSEIILGVYGNYDPAKVEAIADSYLGMIRTPGFEKKRSRLNTYRPQHLVQQKNSVQSHMMIGNRCFSIKSKYKTAMLLLNNYLGGPGMSSRLNMEIREKYGICYTIESNYNPFMDTGAFSIYMGTEKEKMERCRQMVMKELKLLREKKMGTTVLHQAKQKFIGQISLAEENRLSVLISLCKSVLDHGKADSLPLIYSKINAVTADEVIEICNEVFDTDQLSSLTFTPQS